MKRKLYGRFGLWLVCKYEYLGGLRSGPVAGLPSRKRCRDFGKISDATCEDGSIVLKPCSRDRDAALGVISYKSISALILDLALQLKWVFRLAPSELNRVPVFSTVFLALHLRSFTFRTDSPRCPIELARRRVIP